jgi:MFS transporter, SET family, sugar efflux transporter
VHASPIRVTVYLVVAPLAAVVVSTLLGRLSDRRAIRRRLLIGAALAGCTSSVLFAVVRDYWVLLALVASTTATAGSLVPQVFAYARTALRGSGRGAMTLSSLRTLFSVAWVAGPPAAAVVLGAGGFTAVYAFSAVMYAIAAVIAYLGLVEQEPVRLPAEGMPGDPAPVASLDAAPRVIRFTQAAFMLLQCASNLGVQLMSLFVLHDLHGTIRQSGLILGLCAGLEVPLMLGLGLLASRVPLRRLILIGPLFSVAYFSIAAISTHTWQLAAAQILNAGAIAAIQGLGVTYFQDLIPRHPGRASTLYSNGFPAGAMLAGPILGVATHIGYRYGYAAAVVLGVAGFVLLRMSQPPPIAPSGAGDVAVPPLAGDAGGTDDAQQSGRVRDQNLEATACGQLAD